MASTYVYVSNAEDGDLSGFSLDRVNKRLIVAPRHSVAPLVMPLASRTTLKSSGERYDGTLYAVTRAKPYALLGYRISPDSGALQSIGVTALPDSMVNVRIDRSGRWLLAVSYGGNSLTVVALDANGVPAEQPVFSGLSGASKPHAIEFSADNRTVYIPHLGSDEIHVYGFDTVRGTLEPRAADKISVAPGTGPRHLVWSRDKRFLYVLGEFRGTVTVFECDAETGQLEEIQCISSLPDTTRLRPGAARAPSAGANSADAAAEAEAMSRAIFCADMHITPDGRFLYTSERTDSTLSLFEVDSESGKLMLKDLTPTENQPRGFAIDSTGQFMVVAGQKSTTVSLYTIDSGTGALTLVDKGDAGRDANWVSMVDI